MKEEDLHKMSISELFDIMVKSVNELLDMHKNHDHLNMEEKRREVQLIQKILIAKKDALEATR